MYERIIEQYQRLGRYVGDLSAADGRKRDRRVEREQHGTEEVALHAQVDRATAVAIERPARRPPAALEERCQVNRHRRAERLVVQSPRYREHRVADRLTF